MKTETTKYTAEEIQQSINSGYLRPDWQEESEISDLLKTEDGEIIHPDDSIICEDGEIFHAEKDSDRYGFDEYHEVYRPEDELVNCYGRRGREYVTRESDCVYFFGNYYQEDYLSDNDIVYDFRGNLAHMEDVYFWESDSEYHHETEPEEEEEEEEEETPVLWNYNSGVIEKNYINDPAPGYENLPRFGFGMEIEKSEMPSFFFDKQEVYERTGAVLERDGSVSDGFELKTPIYNLFSPETDKKLKELEGYANVKGIRNAGGHIGFSMEGKNDRELLNLCRGFIPIIYAMHKKRLTNSYSEGKPIEKLIRDADKMQSIRLRDNYIEFRIFGAVRSFNSVLFRLDLFRIIARNLGDSFINVIYKACKPSHPLNMLLLRVYDSPERFTRLILDSCEIHNNLNNGTITQATKDRLISKINSLFSNLQK